MKLEEQRKITKLDFIFFFLEIETLISQIEFPWLKNEVKKSQMGTKNDSMAKNLQALNHNQ